MMKSIYLLGFILINTMLFSREKMIISSAKEDNIKNLKKYINMGYNIYETDRYSYTALEWAAKKGHSRIIKHLLASGFDLNKAIDDFNVSIIGMKEYKKNLGYNSLLLAIKNNHLETVKVLLENKVDLKPLDPYVDKPLVLAAELGFIEMVKTLIKAGIDINEASPKGTAIRLSSRNGHTSVVKLLFEHDVNLDIDTKLPRIGYENEGTQALFEAMENKHYGVVKVLKSNGVRLNKKQLELIENEKNRKLSQDVLVDAAGKGDFELVKKCYNEGFDLFKPNKDSSFALKNASRSGHTKIVKFILSKEFHPLKTPKISRTRKQQYADSLKKAMYYQSLYIAIEYKNQDVVSLLLSNKTSEEFDDPSKISLLPIAAKKGLYNSTEMLIKAGFDVNAPYYTGNALNIAARKGYSEIVRLLIDNGADLYVKNSYGKIPLLTAAYNNNFKSVELLLKAGSYSKKDEEIVKFLAYENGRLRVIQLLDNNDINETIDYQQRLTYAVKEGHFQVVEYLIKKYQDKININYHNKKNREYSPLILAVKNGNEKVTEILIKNGADINYQVDGGYALKYATEHQNIEIIKLLNENPEKIKLKNLEKALNIAIERQNIDIVQYFLLHGVDIDKFSPIFIAVEKGNYELTKLLIDKGAKIDRKKHNGFTPLMVAKDKVYKDIVNLLLSKGAKNENIMFVKAKKYKSNYPVGGIYLSNSYLLSFEMGYALKAFSYKSNFFFTSEVGINGSKFMTGIRFQEYNHSAATSYSIRPFVTHNWFKLNHSLLEYPKAKERNYYGLEIQGMVFGFSCKLSYYLPFNLKNNPKVGLSLGFGA